MMHEHDINNFPFEIEDLSPSENEELLNNFKGEHTGFVRVGPKGYVMPHKYREQAAHLYSMPVRPGDTFVVSYPRSGTTLTQELVWMLGNDLDYNKSNNVPLSKRFPFLELSTLYDPVVTQQLRDENQHSTEKLAIIEKLVQPGVEKLGEISSPRFIKSHLPLSLLPPDTLDKAKVVYVARDPRDVAVSFFHFSRLFRILGFVGEFETYWKLFISNKLHWTPFFDHLKEAWERRNHPNVLFLFYEDLVKDLSGAIQKTAKFLEKEYTVKQIDELCDYLRFDNFKNNKSVNLNELSGFNVLAPGEQNFIRKGKVGGWRGYFDDDMAQEAEQWIIDNLQDTDLRFPSK